VSSLKIPKTPASARKRATIAVMNSSDPIIACKEADLKEQRRGSAPENFFTKVSNKLIGEGSEGGKKQKFFDIIVVNQPSVVPKRNSRREGNHKGAPNKKCSWHIPT
jgi:hypothetical protein